jgi:phosphoenolpyruvate carboxykinase (ATP)
MKKHDGLRSHYGLENHGIANVGEVYWNLRTAALYEEAVRRQEGLVAHGGPFVVRTGEHTGRSPNDKFVVREPSSEDRIWWSKVNPPFDPDRFDHLYARLMGHLEGKDLFVQDCFAGADPEHRVPIRMITETAWSNILSRNQFIQVPPEQQADFVPEYTLICAPTFPAIPEIDGTNSDVCIITHFGKKLIVVGTSSYGGEIKKSIFTVLNYVLPQQGVLSMHCSANVGHSGDVAVFFGLSGTGKTSLSADPHRRLIGDDQHGWSDHGVFNFEGGCYAKVIRLSPESEPQIYQTTQQFGTILENVVIDPATRHVDLDDASITENTRATYPLTHIPNHVVSGMAGHPDNIVFLTADAFGVMPPIAKLTPQQAMYHFLSGYTAKLAGTEKGVADPEATFSTCFSAPFLALHPTVYAHMLGDKIERHHVQCWLVNTGWTGGPHGIGHRMEIEHTRAMVEAALSGKLQDVSFEPDPIFGVLVPSACCDVPSQVLKPRDTWPDQAAYDEQARSLARMFIENFEEFADMATEDVRAAGPRVG